MNVRRKESGEGIGVVDSWEVESGDEVGGRGAGRGGEEVKSRESSFVKLASR